jgi:hypothetical protein
MGLIQSKFLKSRKGITTDTFTQEFIYIYPFQNLTAKKVLEGAPYIRSNQSRSILSQTHKYTMNARLIIELNE